MNNRLEHLDSSRGLAALSVVFSHFFAAYGLLPFLTHFDGSIIHFIWHGEGAVTYFYILSGYVLTIGIFQKNGQLDNLSITGYVVRRMFRIFPLFLVCLWMSFILLKIYSSYSAIVTYPLRSDWIMGLWSGEKTFIEALMECILVIPIPSESSLRLVPQDWTLRVELICSSIVPITALILERAKSWFILFLAFLILMGNFTFIAFAFGMSVGYYSGVLEARIEKLHGFFVLLILLSALCLYTIPFNFLSTLVNGHPARIYLAECIGSTLILVCLIGNRTLKKILSHSFFIFLGRISFGIYLTHLFILIGIIPLVVRFLNQHQMRGDFSTRLISLATLLLITVAVSFLLYEMIEKPFNKFGKKLAGKYFDEKSHRTEIPAMIVKLPGENHLIDYSKQRPGRRRKN
jgi:peptidoglycan/LPS O-acetylase OafA/YrhL